MASPSRIRDLTVAVLAGAGMVLGIAVAACATPPPEEDANAGVDHPTPTEPAASTTFTAEAGAPDASSTACVTAPPNNKCGLVVQCGCAATETCDVTNHANGATSCVTAGSATLGRACATTSDCIAGLTCLGGACRPYCDAPNTKCSIPGTDRCIGAVENGNAVPNLNACSINCDPGNPRGACGAGACLWFPYQFAPATVSDCRKPGPQGAFQPCNADIDCQPSLTCLVSASRGRECEPWCRIGGNDCPQNFHCADIYGPAAPVINGIKEGVCQD